MKNQHLSYETHDGNELKLMLKKQKPFAFFVHPVSEEASFLESEGLEFDKHVQSGELIRVRVVLRAHDIDFALWMYTLPSEEWRSKAFIVIYEAFLNCKYDKKWNEIIDRALGSLLGYNKEQNEEYIEKNKEFYTRVD